MKKRERKTKVACSQRTGSLDENMIHEEQYLLKADDPEVISDKLIANCSLGSFHKATNSGMFLTVLVNWLGFSNLSIPLVLDSVNLQY